MAVAGVILSYRAGHPIHANLFNADALYLPVLFQDLFERGGQLSDWFLTPAPYFFPDYLLYLGAYAAGSDIYWQILVYALLQIICTLIALLYVAKGVADQDRGVAAVLMTVVLVWMSLHAGEPFVELLANAFHFGAFLSTLAFLALWLRMDRQGHGGHDRAALIGMCVITYLTALSDNLFLVQAVAPFIATQLLLHRREQPLRGRLTESFAVLAAAGLGSLSYKLVVAHNTRVPAGIGIGKFGANAHDLLQILHTLFLQFPFLGVLVVAHMVLGIAGALTYALKGKFMNLPRPLLLLWSFSVASQAATVFALLFVTLLPVAPRYLIPVLFWPLIIGVLVARHLLRQHFYWAGVAVAALLSSMLLFDGIRSSPATPVQAYYPEQIACIDRALGATGLRNGIAQYWDAKYVQAFSQHRLALAQHDYDLHETRWITSERYFRPAYDFAIISEDAEKTSSLPAHLIVATNGEPAQSVACGNRTVLLFGPDKLRLKRLVNLDAGHRWRGCMLPTQLGKPTPACEIEKTDPDTEGFLTYGPYEALAAGKYVFEIDYASSMPATGNAGEWDVVLNSPGGANRIHAGAMPGTDNRNRTLSGTFDVSKRDHMAKLEIRIKSNKNGTMKVNALWVKHVP